MGPDRRGGRYVRAPGWVSAVQMKGSGALTMIESVRGELLYATEDSAVVECGGIGYAVFMPASSLADLPQPGNEVRLHTHLSVTQDDIRLFGFFTRDELEIFRMLIGVSGIGPKIALSVLSTLPPDDLRFAVLSDDVKAISSAPGIGKKGAQKIILDLKDKMDLQDAFDKRGEHAQAGAGPAVHAEDAVAEAVQALTALGYSSTEAFRAVRSLEIPEDADVEAILKMALKKLALF